MYAVQPDSIPPRVPGMHVFVYNVVTDDKRAGHGEWVSARLLRPVKKGDKKRDKNGRMVQEPMGWWMCAYFDGEELPMPISDVFYKSKISGNGWVLDVHHASQPRELVPFCVKGVAARARKRARRKPLAGDSSDDDDDQRDGDGEGDEEEGNMEASQAGRRPMAGWASARERGPVWIA